VNRQVLLLALELRNDDDARKLATRLDPIWALGQAAVIARASIMQGATALVIDALGLLVELTAVQTFWAAHAAHAFVPTYPNRRVAPLVIAFRQACEARDISQLEALAWWCSTPLEEVPRLEPLIWPEDDHGPGEEHERGGPH